jgi:squalene synthase HpnC
MSFSPAIARPDSGTQTQPRLDGAPVEYAMPSARPTLAEAQAWCRHLATTHYENFHVATFFLPRRIRPYFESIYAFSRVADDLGDEVADRATATRLLGEWRTLLQECYEQPQRSQHPVFVALRATVDRTQAPMQLFEDLIRAFEMDQTLTHHASIDSLLAYSRLSANPVGRLVLWVSGYRDEERALLSDKVCTALQLANFWQDVVEDWQRGRRYLPAAEMQRFGVTEDDLAARRFTPEFAALMKSLVHSTRTMLAEGGAISASVDADLATTLRLFVAGGHAALDGVVAQRYDVLSRRASVSKSTKLRLLGGALLGKAVAALGGDRLRGTGKSR